jgi:hypothetical protein
MVDLETMAKVNKRKQMRHFANPRHKQVSIYVA